MTIAEWMGEVDENVGSDDSAKYADAMQTLLSWPQFRKEYQGMGFDILVTILKSKINLNKKGAYNG